MSSNEREPVISIRNISKVYKLYDNISDRLKESLNIFSNKKKHAEFFALHDISFDIYPGQTIGLIGKNGSGKSTLLKIITGVLTPTQGYIKVKGKISAILELGTGFNHELSGMENIFLYGTIMGLSKKEMESKLNSILTFADIGEFINQPVKMYSSGMFARLAFAVAINVDADILIVDEALAVGDIAFQFKCYKKFNELKKSGKTIIFVTHSMDTILKYCDSAVLINNGNKIGEGNTKDMVDLYKKILVDNYDFMEQTDTTGVLDKAIVHHDLTNWKNSFEINAEYLDYGNKHAEIIDYGIFNEREQPIINVQSDEKISIKMRVRFSKHLRDPIFAFTIKDLKGFEVVGTNTMYEMIEIGDCFPGDEKTVIFSQTTQLQAGNYTLSLGCTGFEGSEFIVYHRLYDIIIFNVLLNRNVVGLYNINSKVEIR